MNGTIAISDGLVPFRLGDQSFSLDPIETIRECNAIAERFKDSTDQFATQEELAKWVAEKTSGQVKLSLTQADELWRAIVLEYRRSQQVFTDALKSLSSTASTPAA